MNAGRTPAPGRENSASRGGPCPPGEVAVVVIGYNDAGRLPDAVRSALAQGAAVREVVAVDDCSTDGSAALLDQLAAGQPRLRVLRRAVNSGGCGSPRNTGMDAVTAPYLMFLDSDDVLPPGAVDALLTAARAADAEVASGRCVRRELPSGRERPWQAALYAEPAVVERPARLPRLVHDTLCVNKLYRTAFLREHDIRFPEGRFLYEDFVFTARVLAADPRIALVPAPVYVWHVRRQEGRLSLSLDRAGVDNWRARVRACATAHAVLLDAGQKELARAARAKFLDHELRMYARDLPLRDEPYRQAWWQHTRTYLEGYAAADLERGPAAPGRLLARVILASPGPRDLPRLRELAARPARLCPPYATGAYDAPVWSDDLSEVSLAPLLHRPARLLPLAIDAELRPRARGLRLRLHEMYGLVARAAPHTVETEWHPRDGSRAPVHRTARLAPAPGGSWTALVPFDPAALGAGTWDLRLRLHFADGSHRDMTAHALAGPGLLRRTALPNARHGVLLVHPYATHSGALALRVAPGMRGIMSITHGRLSRLLP